MRQFLILVFSALLFSSLCKGQRLAILSSKNVGGNKGMQLGKQVTHTPDGGFILRFTTRSLIADVDVSCNRDTMLSVAVFQKYDPGGSIVQWQKCYFLGDTSTEYLFPQADGNFIVGGVLMHSPAARWFLRKEDPAGNIIWYKSYGPDSNGYMELKGMVPSSDGGYLMGGNGYGNNGDIGFHYGSYMSNDCWILKLDSLGNKVWSKVVGGTAEDILANVVPARDGGCYFAGTTFSNDYDCSGSHNSPFSYADAYVARIDNTGSLKWHRCLGGSLGDVFTDAVSDNKGGIIAAGSTSSTDGDVHHHIGGADYWITDLDSSGNILWDNCYGSSSNDEVAFGICRTPSNRIYVTGRTLGQGGQIDTAYGSDDHWVILLDSVRNLMRQRVLGSTGTDQYPGIVSLQLGGAIAWGLYGYGDGNLPPLFQPCDISDLQTYLVRFSPWPLDVNDLSGLTVPQVTVSPNPTDGIFTAKIEGLKGGGGTLVVSDMFGRNLVVEKNIKDKTVPINIYNAPRGIYLITYENEGGRRIANRIVKI